MDKDSTEERIKRLQERVLADIRKFRELHLTILEAEIMDHLIDGQKNAVELVEHIYGLQPNDTGYNAGRLKVRRALTSLEKKGFISTRMFGRDKPYRITQHGMSILANMSPETDRPKIVSNPEVGLFITTLICGLAMLFYSEGIIGNPVYLSALGIFAFFFLLLGFSLAVFFQILRRVF
jgi:hypothetical protein